MAIDGRVVADSLLELLQETFERSHGIYLDADTSIFETLETIPAERAGTRFHGIQETIAGHVSHSTFYLRVLRDYMEGRRERADWAGSWKVTGVDEAGWQALKAGLRDEYGKLRDKVRELEVRGDEEMLGCCLESLSHCAFHLGIIRMLKDF